MDRDEFSGRTGLMCHEGDVEAEGIWRWFNVKVVQAAEGQVRVDSRLISSFRGGI